MIAYCLLMSSKVTFSDPNLLKKTTKVFGKMGNYGEVMMCVCVCVVMVCVRCGGVCVILMCVCVIDISVCVKRRPIVCCYY